MATTQEKERASAEIRRLDTGSTLPKPAVAPEPSKATFHASVYIIAWIGFSSSVILFNKWILHSAKFGMLADTAIQFRGANNARIAEFPLFLTTWHLTFATVVTQIMARYTKLLDSRHSVPMTGRVYLRAIVPIGFFFSLSLICGNLTYLYLSVSFIQMLKATNVVATLFATWAFGIGAPNLRTLGNVSFIVAGVVIASYGEVQFVLIGFIYQVAGIIFEAIRLVMVQRLLSSAEFKMDPLVSLYYFAPSCALINGVCTLIIEIPKMTMEDIYKIGMITLLSNALVAFMLNVSVVFLIGKTSAFVLTLSGVLKDILLVIASMVIFRDPVTPTQFAGYSIALGGLVYYKVGAGKLSEYVAQSRITWSQFTAKNPASGKVIVFCMALLVLSLMLAGLSPYVSDAYKSGVLDKMKSIGDKTSTP